MNENLQNQQGNLHYHQHFSSLSAKLFRNSIKNQSANGLNQLTFQWGHLKIWMEQKSSLKWKSNFKFLNKINGISLFICIIDNSFIFSICVKNTQKSTIINKYLNFYSKFMTNLFAEIIFFFFKFTWYNNKE